MTLKTNCSYLDQWEECYNKFAIIFVIVNLKTINVKKLSRAEHGIFFTLT